MKLFGSIDFEKFKSGLSKTRNNILNKINEIFTDKTIIDDSLLDDIEDTLISADIGVNTTEFIIKNAKLKYSQDDDKSLENFKIILKNELINIIQTDEKADSVNSGNNKPYIYLIIGVNGAGKTTTIGKLAYYFKKNNYKVLIGAADTYRAAANDQLKIWAERVGVEVIYGNSKDPGSVVFDTLATAYKTETDIVLIDTAGRLHTQNNLMDELSKIKNVINKFRSGSFYETLLVVDGNSGQNAIQQTNLFDKYTKINGLIVTKLDGSTKGGAIFNISHEKKIPVRFIGLGENIEDLQIFDPKAYVNAIFENNK